MRLRLRWRSVLADDTCRCWKVDKKDLSSLERGLKLVGATDVSVEVGKHIKVKFANDGEKALVTISATASDRRARKNFVADIRRELNRIGITDQRFEMRLVVSLQQMVDEAQVWELLDKWESHEATRSPEDGTSH